MCNIYNIILWNNYIYEHFNRILLRIYYKRFLCIIINILCNKVTDDVLINLIVYFYVHSVIELLYKYDAHIILYNV